jgi:hypothetical protein
MKRTEVTRTGLGILTCLIAAAGAHGRALAAPPSVEAFAGAVGGIASGVNVPGTCSTYLPPEPEYSFFTSSPTMAVPQGGITACGYSGDVGSTTSAVGPVMASQSVPSVLLGNPGLAGTYTGSADAIADYQTLKVAAHGTVTAPGTGGPLSLHNSSAAAIFDDTLTSTSPRVAISSPGFVRYTFAFDGAVSAPGPVTAGIPGLATATLNIEHDGGGNFGIVRVDVTRGSTGTVHALDGSTGTFVAGPGSISGSGNFTSTIFGQFGEIIDRPFIWGQPFRLRAGLMATVIGDGEANFLSTGRLVRIDFFDATHAPVTDVTIVSASGTDYATPGAPVADAGVADAPAADAGADARPAEAPIDAAPAPAGSSGGCSHAPGGRDGWCGAVLLLVLFVAQRSLVGKRLAHRQSGGG